MATSVHISCVGRAHSIRIRLQIRISSSLTLPGLARRSDKPSAARGASGRRPRGGRWEEAAHRQGRFLRFQKPRGPVKCRGLFSPANQ
eukprot:185566-Prorocentrum_minimum.AAC.1